MNNVAYFSDYVDDGDGNDEDEEQVVSPNIDDHANVTVELPPVIGVDERPAKRTKIDWEPCGLPSQRRINLELDPVFIPVSECFGCTHVGERNKTVIRYKQIVELIDIIRQSIGHCDKIALAKHVAKRYREIQNDINRHLQPNEEPLPDWPAGMILDHILNHNIDPDLQLAIDLEKIQEMAGIAERAAVEVDPEDDTRERINPQQCREFRELKKLYWQLAKTDTSKARFKSNESYIDMKSMCQPIIKFTNKTILDYYGANNDDPVL